MKTLTRVNYKSEENPFLKEDNSTEKTLNTKVESSDGEKEKMISLPVAQLTKLLEDFSKLADKLTKDNNASNLDAKIIAEAVERGISFSLPKRSSIINQKTFNKEDIPYEDILEKPALFIAFCMTTVIFDDVVSGHTVNMPHAPVKFNPFLRYEDANKKGTIITQSIAIVHSKAQAEFIRNHSYFNIMYFEKLDSAKSYNTEVIDRLMSAYDSVRKLTDYQVKQKCVELNITINTNDFVLLRKELAQKIAAIDATAQDSFQQQYIEDRSKAEKFRETRVEATY